MALDPIWCCYSHDRQHVFFFLVIRRSGVRVATPCPPAFVFCGKGNEDTPSIGVQPDIRTHCFCVIDCAFLCV